MRLTVIQLLTRNTKGSLSRNGIKMFVMSCVLLVGLMTAPLQAQAAKYAAFVMEADTGRVLFARNADALRYPASLTKMMTLYMTFDAIESGKLSWSQKLPISKRAAGQPPSKLGLRQGRTISVKDAAMALITKSANDAATVLSEAIGGTEWEFAIMMTNRAREMGMSKTTFRNASGLPDRRQRSTARDMAKLGLALQRDFPQHYHLFNTTSFTYNGTRYRNHNRLLSSLNGTNGIKTGYIRASGFNLVSSVTRNGKTLIGVVYGGRSARTRDAHMVKIINQAFKRAGPVTRVARATTTLPTPSPRTAELLALQSIEVAAVRPVPRPSVNSPATPTVAATATSTTARTEVAALTPTVTTAIGNTRGIWGIQVGAFQNKDSASKQITRAIGKLPSALKAQAKEILEAYESEGRKLYRARVGGYDRTTAVQACGVLMANNVRCVTIPPERLSLNEAG